MSPRDLRAAPSAATVEIMIDSLDVPLGAQVRITIEGRVGEHSGRPVIQTPDGALWSIPASATVEIIRPAQGPLYVAGGNWRPSDGSIR